MQLRYDEDFIEAAAFLCARGRRPGVPAMQIGRFHRERERLYGILDPEERNAAFFRLHLDWFREWGLELPLSEVMQEFPVVRAGLHALAVRKSSNKNDEGAELYVNDTAQRTGLLTLRIERFLDDRALRHYLRHEFTHLHDMLDPGFGYSPVVELPDLNPAQLRLAVERYRLVWDITIDARLAAAGHRPECSREQHAAGFARGFAFWSESKQNETFAALWQTPAPRHATLLTLVADPRGWRSNKGPAPGAACPLCGFPTFAWADAGSLGTALRTRVETEFPTWLPEQGLCQRCLEAYEVGPLPDGERVNQQSGRFIQSPV